MRVVSWAKHPQTTANTILHISYQNHAEMRDFALVELNWFLQQMRKRKNQRSNPKPDIKTTK